ncbi:MAG: phosphoribosylanthranilate isomerase [Endomicrobium sp.]|jgi:phosphoribosylanthranilate isomerase|nr:phosphoribosylanthranilate isomerase [Endomicrobium sp.]
MVKVKICGLKRKEDIEYVNLTKPDYAGFVFAGVKRKIDFKTAEYLRSLLDDKIQAVGVFVDEPIENIAALCKADTIDLIQLHGGEDENYIDKLRQKTGAKIIKAVKVELTIDGGQLNSQTVNFKRLAQSKADFILFDSGAGSGKTFDWNLIKGYDKPFFLAGGLNKDNIEKAVKTLNPYCVDLSGGVETNGLKDFDKISEIIKITRNLQ